MFSDNNGLIIFIPININIEATPKPIILSVKRFMLTGAPFTAESRIIKADINSPADIASVPATDLFCFIVRLSSSGISMFIAISSLCK